MNKIYIYFIFLNYIKVAFNHPYSNTNKYKKVKVLTY